MKRWVFHCLVASALALAGCEQSGQSGQVTFQQRILPHPNLTSYEFNATVAEVKDAVKGAFDKWEDEELRLRKGKVWNGPGDAEAKRRLTSALQDSPRHPFWKAGEAYGRAMDILARPGNENDAYFDGTESPAGESAVYFTDGQPLIYYAGFHIHITAVGPKRTRVEIFTYDSSVAVGAEKAWTVHGHNISLITSNIEPTTVEEYQILLRIGEQLGEKNMPPLATPGTNAPAKQITKPRRS